MYDPTTLRKLSTFLTGLGKLSVDTNIEVGESNTLFLQRADGTAEVVGYLDVEPEGGPTGSLEYRLRATR